MADGPRTFEIGHSRIELVEGDIVVQEVDAIVTAANSALAGGGGVDGAVHWAAGPELLDACDQIGGCPTGSAVLTPGFDLPSKHVIHAVGPIWEGGDANEEALLASAYRRSLQVAAEHDVRSTAFPAISAGVYGYPMDEAARVALRACAHYLRSNPGSSVRLVRFVLYDARSFEVFARVADAELGKP
ncbi:MAG: O-acetyl-ADP-ribose deacetylase [Candidatus Eisenbacteria bacterium]